MKAIGYIRVSTEGQAEKGISLEAQRAKIEAYAVTKDLELVEIIEDAGLSAKNLKRPGVRKVLDMARRKEVDAVVIVKLDRMFRNTVDALETAQAFDRRGVGLHSISESLDTQSAMGKFFFTLTAALAEMERGLVGERTKAALAQKRRKGEATGGSTPYGFDRDGERLTPNPEEQKTLKHMESLRLQGKSFQAIADALNMDGIPTKQGNPWSRVRVFKILQNTTTGDCRTA